MRCMRSIIWDRRAAVQGGREKCGVRNAACGVDALLCSGVIGVMMIVELSLLWGQVAHAQVVPPDTTQTPQTAQIPTQEDALRALPGMDQVIPSLSFRSVPISDILRALADQYKLNLFVGPNVQGTITLNLSAISVADALLFIITRSGLTYTISNRVLQITAPPAPAPPPPAPPQPPQIIRADSLISVEVSDHDLAAFARELTRQSGRNVLLEQGVSGRLSGYIEEVPFDTGLRTLLDINGYSLRVVDGIYRIDRAALQADAQGRRASRAIVSVRDSLVTLDVDNADINVVLREIALQSGIDLITYGRIQGVVSARLTDVSLDRALNYLFRGTDYTFRREQDIYFVGNKDIRGITSMVLILLDHLKADGIIDLLPERLKSQATIRVVKEHNSLLVTGTQDIISEVEEFVGLIDQPSPQILLDVLVVDLRRSDDYEVGFTAGQDTSALPLSSYFPGIRLTYPGVDLESFFSVGLIGRLPPNFRAQFRALEREGRVNVRSQPKIATLNGHEASITIGTTQYFLLESQGTFPTPGSPVTQTSQRFERIEANAILKITPWVSASGEITTVIHPEFNTPVGTLSADVPPTIDSRVIDSTVRLRDGETIILGGLIEESDQAEINKFPLLGDIPVLGRLFQHRKVSKVKNQLVIFVTPHLYYGSEGAVDVEAYLKQ